MGATDIINVTTLLQAKNPTRPGFGTPLILAPLSELPGGFLVQTTRSYSSAASVAVDFALTSTTYLMAAAMFAQNPCPPVVKVGALSSSPTQVFTLVPTVLNSTVYSGTIDGQAWTYTSGGGATLSAICAGIGAAIAALTLAHAVTVTEPSNTSVVVTANTAGDFHSMSVTNTVICSIAQTHGDIPSALATDIAAINVYDNNWYAPCFGFNSKACIGAIAGWVESNMRLYVAQSQDSILVDTTAGADATSVWFANRAKTRTALIYKKTTSDFADAAWLGACLPLIPGSETWAYKTLNGVNPDALTETQHQNAVYSPTTTSKFVNTYETVAGLNLTQEGTVCAGEWIDNMRFTDWLVINMQNDLIAYKANASKIPYTDSGIQGEVGVVQARLDLGVQAGGFTNNPAPKASGPLAANVSSGDRLARVLNNLTFSAQFADAIQFTNVTGSIAA